MNPSHRTLKVADRIKVVVAQLLETKIKDPRLGFVTVTDARVTGDLQMASVFYTVLGDDDARASTAAALESAKGAIRSALGRELGLRITPSIEFFEDGLPESAKALDSLLARVHEQDAEVAALRKNATYAGGEDPYKAPRIIESE
ncbi:MAG: 30S ribosome-binding factor RbfA [Candidatus Planktophila sp.]|jgi:ribosome-binding factor A|nr:30S ribosome-binding factor RbfA [Candidatus Planktophila sp.]